MQLLLTNTKTCEELVTCVAEVFGAPVTPNKLIAYVGVLEKIPMGLLRKVAGRILETEKPYPGTMPLPARWCEIASAIYEELERDERMARRRVESKLDPAKRLTPENLRQYMEERAQAANDDPVAMWCQNMLNTLDRGKPSSVAEMLLGGMNHPIPREEQRAKSEPTETPEEAGPIPL